MTAADLAAAGQTRMPPAAQQWMSPVGVRPTTDGIEWLPRESLDRGGVIVPSNGLLEDFLALREASNVEVADFAAQHGVLGVAESKWRRLGEYAQEPLDAWREEVSIADALLAAAGKLRAGQPLSDDQRVPVLRAAWPKVVGDTDEDAALREALLQHAGRTLEDDRQQLAWAVSTWMHTVGVQLVLTWPTGAAAPALSIGGEMSQGCLQAITVQVALACSRADTARTCDGCGGLHAPRRQPKPGQRSFCQKCREAGVPVKLANRDRRAKHRERVGSA